MEVLGNQSVLETVGTDDRHGEPSTVMMNQT